MAEQGSTFAISEAQSQAFASLSGDFNPLHVDAVAARRLQFGGTVCHGVQLALTALERAAEQGLLTLDEVQSVHAVFSAPVRTGDTVSLALSRAPSGAGERARIVGSREGRSLFTLTLGLGPQQDAWLPVASGTHVAGSAPSAPKALGFSTVLGGGDGVAALAGRVDLPWSADLLQQLFPALSQQRHAWGLLADMLATTRIVGMECPGLHSVYAELKLHRAAVTAAADTWPSMSYEVQQADARFNKLRIGVAGVALAGTLHALFRADVVRQKGLQELRQVVTRGRFTGQKALIVGGSRGLGELVGKMLLAGGADLTLTYAHGQADAEAIVAEARALGAPCTAVQIDMSRPLGEAQLRHLGAQAFTHLYYFASPPIARGNPTTWSAELFQQFSRFYVSGFLELLQAVATGARAKSGDGLTVLYPSTVFLDEPPKGFAEYCAAKAAGEVASRHAAEALHLNVHAPRLPRLRTDQNSALDDPGVADPVPVMDEVLRRLCDTSAGAAA